MPLGTEQLRAMLLWEIACERFRNALQAPKGAPETSPAELLAAYRLAQDALEATREAFEINQTDTIPQIRNLPRNEDPMAMRAEQVVDEHSFGRIEIANPQVSPRSP